jgi:hypothetical protein
MPRRFPLVLGLLVAALLAGPVLARARPTAARDLVRAPRSADVPQI